MEQNKIDSLQEIAELTSLGMTLPTVILAIAVVYMWLPSAREAWKKSPKKAHDWFIMFFRQGLGIIAAWCHLKAAEVSDKAGLKFLSRLLCVSNLLGVTYVLYLISKT
jgi:hypothetical protein